MCVISVVSLGEVSLMLVLECWVIFFFDGSVFNLWLILCLVIKYLICIVCIGSRLVVLV